MENLENTEKYKEEKKLSAVSLSRDNTINFFVFSLSLSMLFICMSVYM